MIIVSITGPGMREALRQVSASSPYADAFEFRLDLITKPVVRTLLASTSKPTIAACRPLWEGGKFEGTEAEREKILTEAFSAGLTYLDIELNASPLMRSRLMALAGAKNVILSHHVFSSDHANVQNLYGRLRAGGAGIVKLAFTAADASDAAGAFDFLALAKADRQRAVAIALGDAGEMTRVLYRKFGGWATYAAAETGDSAAPGQIPASRLKNVYRAEKIDQGTKVFGVIGNPLLQSKGVFIHNELFRRAGMNAVYCRFPVINLDGFMARVAPLLSGFSVTIPHKEDIIPYLEETDRQTTAIGAVNTVIRRANRLHGSNTDAPGALDAIEDEMRVKGNTVLIVGAGGAARAIAFESKRRGAETIIANRTEERAAALARALGVRQVSMKDLPQVNFDVLVNATSVGMVPRTDEIPVPSAILRNRVVFDAVYNPPVTRLLAETKRAGGTVVSGTKMYLNQAALQSKLFTGKNPSRKLMGKILEDQLHH